MWLQHKIYGFAQMDGSKVTTKKLLSSTLLVNDKPTEIPILRLFKGVPTEKESAVKGYSILEYLNQNGDIEVDGKIYNIKFVDDKGITFKLIGMKNPDFVMKDKEFTDAEMEEVSSFIKASAKVEDTTPQAEVELAATTEATPAETTPTSEEFTAPAVEEKPAGGGVTIFSNEDYNDEKRELVLTGYTVYETNPPSNHHLFIRGTRKILVEITEDDYNTLEDKIYNMQVNTSDKTFTLELKKEFA